MYQQIMIVLARNTLSSIFLETADTIECKCVTCILLGNVNEMERMN
jgi:hypothetical protein